MGKKYLIACELSGVTRRAFRALGYDAWSCDLEPADDGETTYHLQCDVREILNDGWDFMLAHPECKFLTNAAVRWLYTEPGRFPLMADAARFFRLLLDAPIEHIAIENPVMHGYGKVAAKIGKPDFSVQPWWFGDDFKKRTCYWTKNLPKLVKTSDLDGSTAKAECHLASPGPGRSKLRSKTYPGIGHACASQWGNYVEYTVLKKG